VYAAIRGFRPLLLDLTVPVSAGPVPVVMYNHGRSELTGLGAPVEAVPELAARASPVTFAAADSAPLLLIHGTADEGVPFSQSAELVAAYRQAGAQIELVPVDGAGHGFPGINLGALLDRSADFLAQHLAAS
jgi:dipeptidyl aminopeptidase/acylaminoacyl peptidase